MNSNTCIKEELDITLSETEERLITEGVYTREELAEHELTRRGKNICKGCDQPKVMYYRPWCPKCEKPEITLVPLLNFSEVLYRLESIGYTGIKKRLWQFIFEIEEFYNDTYFKVDFKFYLEELDPLTEQQILDLNALQKEFKLPDSVMFFVSW